MSTFDAEQVDGLLGTLFGEIAIDRWDAPLITLPSAADVRDYLIGKGVDPPRAQSAAITIEVPLAVTKRGALAFARKRRCADKAPRRDAADAFQ